MHMEGTDTYLAWSEISILWPLAFWQLKGNIMGKFYLCDSFFVWYSYCDITYSIYEPWHKISNNVVCATSKASDQPAHTRSLIIAFACCLTILWVLSYWLNILWSFYAYKEAAQALLSLHFSKCHIVGNHMPRLIIMCLESITSHFSFDFDSLVQKGLYNKTLHFRFTSFPITWNGPSI